MKEEMVSVYELERRRSRKEKEEVCRVTWENRCMYKVGKLGTRSTQGCDWTITQYIVLGRETTICGYCFGVAVTTVVCCSIMFLFCNLLAMLKYKIIIRIIILKKNGFWYLLIFPFGFYLYNGKCIVDGWMDGYHALHSTRPRVWRAFIWFLIFSVKKSMQIFKVSGKRFVIILIIKTPSGPNIWIHNIHLSSKYENV